MKVRTGPFAWLAMTSLVAAAEPVLTGDLQLFLLIGQSNMAGRGLVDPQDRVPHPRVWVFTKELSWAPAVDPLHFDKPERTGVGLGSSFGRAVANEHPTATVGLIPAAFGGTSLDEWRVGGKLYGDALARTREAMKHGTLAGILWHQGEADAAPELAATYPERFADMMAQLRIDLDAPEVPVIVGEIGHFTRNPEAINEALARIPAQVRRVAVVSSAQLTDKGDQLHFNSPSLRELGRRYAKAWSAMRARSTPYRRN